MALALMLLFGLALSGAVFLAFHRGGRDEKLVAAALVAAAILTPMVQAFSFASTEYGVLVVDTMLLVVLLFVAFRSDRYWPMMAAGFQLTTIQSHLAAGSARLVPPAYADLVVFWSYFVIASLFLGTLIETAELER